MTAHNDHSSQFIKQKQDKSQRRDIPYENQLSYMEKQLTALLAR